MEKDCKAQLFNVVILYRRCLIYNVSCDFKDLKRLSMVSYEDNIILLEVLI